MKKNFYYIWMKLFVYMMKRRRINEYTCRISLVFLIGAEIVFWLSAIGFFLLRYGFRLKKASFIMGIVLLINEVFILTLGVVDYYQTGKFSNFQIITVIILLYAVFYGKKDLKSLIYLYKNQLRNGVMNRRLLLKNR